MDIIQLQQAPASAGNGTPGGSGNATVPSDAPIQPPQAFVDAAAVFLVTPSYSNLGSLDLSNKGITSINPLCCARIANQVSTWAENDVGSLDLSRNALGAQSVNAMLRAFVERGAGAGPQSLIDLSGGTNAAPSGQGLVDLQTLRDAGWTVTVNPS